MYVLTVFALTMFILTVFALTMFVLTAFALTMFILTAFALTMFILTVFVLTMFVLTVFVLTVFALPRFYYAYFTVFILRQFLRSSGINEDQLAVAEYSTVLSAQKMSTEHLESLTDTEKQRLILLAKKPGEPIGLMLIESGWGSMLPTCVVGHMAKSGVAATSNKINIGKLRYLFYAIAFVRKTPFMSYINYASKGGGGGVNQYGTCNPFVLQNDLKMPYRKEGCLIFEFALQNVLRPTY